MEGGGFKSRLDLLSAALSGMGDFKGHCLPAAALGICTLFLSCKLSFFPPESVCLCSFYQQYVSFILCGWLHCNFLSDFLFYFRDFCPFVFGVFLMFKNCLFFYNVLCDMLQLPHSSPQFMFIIFCFYSFFFHSYLRSRASSGRHADEYMNHSQAEGLDEEVRF